MVNVANKLIFFKEVFLKNDLTYLTLSLPLLLGCFDIDSTTVYVVALSAISLLFSWCFSLKQHNVFNSHFKYIIILIVILFFTNNFISSSSSSIKFLGATNIINWLIFSVYTFINFYVTYSLIQDTSHNIYYDASNDYNSDSEIEYLMLTYRMINFDNSILYHYDEKVNIYVYGNLIHEAGSHIILFKEDKQVIGTLSEYFKYFKDLNIDYSSMNKESLDVFKMYVI